jgi:tetratricopeptide (TPR) repeat protein
VATKQVAAGSPAGPQIAIKAWDPKTPYLAAIKAAAAARRYAVYLEQRAAHGAAPAFYLDCAHTFRRLRQPDLALRILSNLAELELENPALLRVLAHRLAQVGELDLSVTMFERVRKLRPEEPQSFRDLALVLERRADALRGRAPQRARADYTRALRLLGRVVMNKWQRFDEIEVIALTELNNILPKARRLGLRRLPVDERLVKHLVMDVRIVMTWDADMTDMDLHVVEPSGEEAYYSHNRTRIGGMVSRDFTQGYGPEVYAVRRAMRGRYRIRTKYFGSSAARLSGGVTLQVDVYTNYGRPNQQRKSITLRLTQRKETFDVGSIRF